MCPSSGIRKQLVVPYVVTVLAATVLANIPFYNLFASRMSV